MDLYVSVAPANISVHSFGDLFVSGIGIFFQQGCGGEYHSAGTEATLHRPDFHECLLDGVEDIFFCEAFYCGYAFFVGA